jgi:hypothetical protein
VTRAPEFRSAVMRGGADGGALSPRRVGRGLSLSIATHVVLGAWIVVAALSEVGPVPPPPLTIRFFAHAPLAPRLVPLRDKTDTPLPPPAPRPAEMPRLMVRPPAPVPFEPPRRPPPPLRVEPDPLPIRVADAAPEVRIRDNAPPPSAPALAPLGAATTPQAGTGEEPALAFLTPGAARQRSSGGGIAGRDQIALPPAGEPLGSIRRGGKDGPAGDGAVREEGAFTGAGLASFLGRRYGVTLTDASRLGSRTSDGARYSLLVPALSEAMRAIRFRGRRPGPPGDPVESIQADAEAVAIRYRDGTVHVLASTPDGLVALFVSAAAAGGGRTKVQEAERALMALQTLGARETRG